MHELSLSVYRGLMRIRPAFLASAIKRGLRIRRRTAQTRFGRFEVDPVSHLGLALLSEGRYEPQMEDFLCSTLRPGMTFVDVGANEGYFSVLASSLVGASGRVLAVEPQMRLQPVISRNLALNDATNVKVAPIAVSDQRGIGRLHMTPDTNSGASGLSRFTKYRLQTQATPLRTLEEALDENGVDRVDLMKMDIESYEYEAILGARDLFGKGRVACLALELHPTLLERRGLQVSDITNCLESAGLLVDTAFENLVYRHPGVKQG